MSIHETALKKTGDPCSAAKGLDERRLPALIIILASFIICGWKIIFRGEVLFFSDVVSFFYPCYRYYSAAILNGEFPFWNPLVSCGVPYAADINKGSFYPLNFIHIVLPSLRTITWMAFFHFGIGAAGVYFFVRKLGVRSVYAAVSGLAFSAVMPMDPAMSSAGAWMGFVLLALYKGVNENFTRGLLLGSVCLSLSLLGGDIHVTFFVLLVSGIFALSQIFTVNRDGAYARLRPVLLFSLIIIFGFALSMIQLLPAFEHSQLSSRPAKSFEYSASSSMTPQALTGLVVPGLWRGWNWRGRLEPAIPAAVLIIILLAAGAIKSCARTRTFMIIAVFSILLALGKYSPVYYLAWRIIPGFCIFRGAIEYLFLMHSALAVFVGLGLEYLTRRKISLKPVVILLVISSAVLLLSIALYCSGMYINLLPAAVKARLGDKFVHVPFEALCSRMLFVTLCLVAVLFLRADCAKRRTFGALLLSLAMIIEIGVGYSMLKPTPKFRTMPAEITDPESSSFAARMKEESVKRIARIDMDLVGVWVDIINGEPENRNRQKLAARLDCIADNENLKYGIAAIDGYNTFQLKSYTDFLGRCGLVKAKDSPVRLFLNSVDYKWFAFLGVSHVVAGVDENNATHVVGPVEAVNEVEKIKLYKMPMNATHGAIIRASEFENDKLPEILTGASLMNTEIRPNSTRYKCVSPEKAILVVPETYYPGWTVAVNGKGAEILEWNGVFRAVEIPEGECKVEFVFRPAKIYFGGMISLLTCFILTGLYFFKGRTPVEKP